MINTKPWPSYPQFGGHQQPLKGSLNQPKKGTKNCQAIVDLKISYWCSSFFSSHSSAFCHDVSNKLVWVVGFFSHPAKKYQTPLQPTTPHRFPKFHHHPVIFGRNHYSTNQQKKSNEKNKANNTTPWFLRQVLRVPLPPSGKTRSSPHQWHRRRVDNVSQVEGHNSWIHRCSLWKNVGMVGSRSWSAKAGVAWSWLVASIKNIYI